ncbi:P-loop containing nucleoside triphosphate hydrolase protein [Cladochytrium replicatum]|nr:P-loop containing nucleoside triphosphate hydrolase protein [Cladochytrium replicatum]
MPAKRSQLQNEGDQAKRRRTSKRKTELPPAHSRITAFFNVANAESCTSTLEDHSSLIDSPPSNTGTQSEIALFELVHCRSKVADSDCPQNDTPRKWTSDELHANLKRYFRITTFRPLQEDIVASALEGRDCLVLMPTGGGKSLVFQLPAVLQSGITLVVSPLLALIQNQVSALQAKGINARSLNSSIKTSERKAIMSDLAAVKPQTKLLYVTPELLASESFRAVAEKLHRNGNLARLVVDEAHCISEWGHDFRKDYQNLKYWKMTYTQLPLMALTATATKRVEEDIIAHLSLNIRTMKRFSTSFNRPNLHYEVRYKPKDSNDPFDDMIHFLNAMYESRRNTTLSTCDPANVDCSLIASDMKPGRPRGVCGIIYCATKATCDEVVKRLRKADIRARAYHGGCTDKVRTMVLASWMRTNASTPAGEKIPVDADDNVEQVVKKSEWKSTRETEVIDVVVCTISFGMGIDKPNVRFVIHWDLPKTLEGYYQESGRAGRDGRDSVCILYYSREDRDRTLFLLNSARDRSNDQHDARRGQNDGNLTTSFEQMVKFCENATICRHLFLCNYFNEDFGGCMRPTTSGRASADPLIFLVQSKGYANLCEKLCNHRCDICRDPASIQKRYKEFSRPPLITQSISTQTTESRLRSSTSCEEKVPIFSMERFRNANAEQNFVRKSTTESKIASLSTSLKSAVLPSTAYGTFTSAKTLRATNQNLDTIAGDK